MTDRERVARAIDPEVWTPEYDKLLAGDDLYMSPTDAAAVGASVERRRARSLTRADAAIAALSEHLSDPVTVHANMLAGRIARPTLDQIRHLYPELAPTWRRIPDEVREGEAPWDGKPWLVCNPRYDAKYPCVAAYRAEEHFSVDWAKKPSWLLTDEHGGALSEWDDRTEDSYPVSCPFTPTHYAPIPPLPAPPAGEVG